MALPAATVEAANAAASILHRTATANMTPAPVSGKSVGLLDLHVVGGEPTVGAQNGKAFHLCLSDQ